MGKINEKTLKDAIDRMHIAWEALTKFNCYGVCCDSCPMRYRNRCIANILGKMIDRADKPAEEAENGNH